MLDVGSIGGSVAPEGLGLPMLVRSHLSLDILNRSAEFVLLDLSASYMPFKFSLVRESR